MEVVTSWWFIGYCFITLVVLSYCARYESPRLLKVGLVMTGVMMLGALAPFLPVFKWIGIVVLVLGLGAAFLFGCAYAATAAILLFFDALKAIVGLIHHVIEGD